MTTTADPRGANGEPERLTLDDLLRPFVEAETPRHGWQIGTEAEKFGVFADGRPLPYEGPRSVRTVLDALVHRHGWSEVREVEGGEVVALRRGRASITLEPGAQLELSGSPLDTIHQTCAEFRGHMAELRDVSAELGVTWLGLGFHPFARQDELPWVPKLRYGVMREYLPTKGRYAHDMMRRTATVQANFDFDDEADAMSKLRVGVRLGPIVTAMFANSPWVEGAATGERTRRSRVWTSVDPDRTGLLPFLWKDDAGYRSYVEWALDAPMFMVKRHGKVVANTGQTFRDFMDRGFEGTTARSEDWESHLNTLFPETRLKRTLEVRQADGQGTALLCALPALWKGVLYDERALEAAEAMSAGFGHDELAGLQEAVADHGLGATLAGRPLLEWARDVLELSEAGLARLGHLNGRGDDERIHLAPLRSLLARGQSPADALRAQVPGGRPEVDAIIAASRISAGVV
ncbi:MAG: glutamate-cysteine ligase family protein [Myxococcota bacterium]